MIDLGMSLQSLQAQRLVGCWKNGPGSKGQSSLGSVVGNVKALFKLNVKMESMEEYGWEWEGL